MNLIQPTNIRMQAECQTCGRLQTIPGKDHDHCVQTLRAAGWNHDYLQNTEVCPTCIQEAQANSSTDKPARRCVLAGSKPGDTILDPFNGAGTTGLVSLETMRKYVGIELNAEYLEITNRRLEHLTSQTPLLLPEVNR
jgi:tRNA/tmRNA/rRNA uracil-C5-methylase (TrmA/RlmC/RlmD family)